MLLLAPAVRADGAADGIDCYCTDREGGRVDLGRSICLVVDGNAFVARCEMALNNPMWRKVMDGCPSAGAPSLLERLQGAEPALYSLAIDPEITIAVARAGEDGEGRTALLQLVEHD